MTMKDITVWWKSMSTDIPHLVQLAVFTLSISPTSGTAERNWSAFSYIHCKKRNRLETHRVDKLVFLYWNLRMLRGIPDYSVTTQAEVLNDSEDADAIAMIGDYDDGPGSDSEDCIFLPDLVVREVNELPGSAD
jgi:hAT family C-terminal dimerisation region